MRIIPSGPRSVAGRSGSRVRLCGVTHPVRKREIPMKSLPVLYQDEHLVAVNKPSGLLVHRSAIDRHEPENAMKIVRDQVGQWVFPVHRLDKSTSGVLVFALDRETARRMTLLFSDAKVSKTYLAVV